MKRDCCNQNCNQGRACPQNVERRSVAGMVRHPLTPEDFTTPAKDRRAGPSLFWRLFGWLMTDRRSGIDRREAHKIEMTDCKFVPKVERGHIITDIPFEKFSGNKAED